MSLPFLHLLLTRLFLLRLQQRKLCVVIFFIGIYHIWAIITIQDIMDGSHIVTGRFHVPIYYLLSLSGLHNVFAVFNFVYAHNVARLSFWGFFCLRCLNFVISHYRLVNLEHLFTKPQISVVGVFIFAFFHQFFP